MKRLALALILTACGTDPSNKEDAAQPVTPPSEEAPATTPTEPVKAVTPYSMALASKKDLPACAEDNAYQLIWVKDEQQFYSCDGEWVLIETPKAAPEEMKFSNIWDDEVTGKVWLVGSEATITQMNALEPCVKEWRRPTTVEISQALVHGMADFAELLGAEPYFWSSEVSFPGFWKFVGADGQTFADWETPGQPMKVTSVCVLKD